VAQHQEKSAMEERLNEVETRIGLAEDLVEELNLVVYRQQQQIELLQSQLRHLHQQLQDGLTAAGERHPT
jgi:SlyX protein